MPGGGDLGGSEIKKYAWLIAFGLVCGLLAAGVILVVSAPQRGHAVQLLPPPTPPPLVVEVAGAVVSPGVFNFPSGSRVQDAIRAAGGLRSDADDRSINLAAFVNDGERLYIPSKTLEATLSELSMPLRNADASLITVLININTASQIDLEQLPYIGPALAREIIAYREANGPFREIADIQKVSGIGPTIFEKIKDLIAVE
jgi:competence protein ComEA